MAVYALDLSGRAVGNRIRYRNVATRTEVLQLERETEEITMITHKKNGRVVVRHGRMNAHVTLHPLTEIVEFMSPREDT